MMPIDTSRVYSAYSARTVRARQRSPTSLPRRWPGARRRSRRARDLHPAPGRAAGRRQSRARRRAPPHRQDLDHPGGPAAPASGAARHTAYVDCLGATDVRGLGERLIDAVLENVSGVERIVRAGEGGRGGYAAIGQGALRAHRAGARSSRARRTRSDSSTAHSICRARWRRVRASASSSRSTSSRRRAGSARASSTSCGRASRRRRALPTRSSALRRASSRSCSARRATRSTGSPYRSTSPRPAAIASASRRTTGSPTCARSSQRRRSRSTTRAWTASSTRPAAIRRTRCRCAPRSTTSCATPAQRVVTADLLGIAYEQALRELERPFALHWSELGKQKYLQLVATRVAQKTVCSHRTRRRRCRGPRCFARSNQLQARGLVARLGRGRYEFVEPMFGEYVRRVAGNEAGIVPKR